MKSLFIRMCELKVRKERIQVFIEDLYYKHYKKEKGKHIATKDKRLPDIKITDDIFSSSIYLKDQNKKEIRIFIDGSVKLNELRIYSITLDGDMFLPSEHEEILRFLRGLTEISEGEIWVETNGYPLKIKENNHFKMHHLLQEILQFDAQNMSEKEIELYDWIYGCIRRKANKN